MKAKCVSGLAFMLFLAFGANAGIQDFKPGPVFEQYGTHAPVAGVSIGADETFKIAFDVVAGAKEGSVNRGFDRLARFINMHVANGASLDNIELAMVVHGAATYELLKNDEFKKIKGTDNANIALLQALMENGVRVLVCGQSAVAKDIVPDMFEKGVEVELSAMTAHAHLNKQGYSLNP